MRLEAHQERPVRGTSEEILGEIREFCRATQTAESTFGRLVVNDGKLVSRLRDGAKITTGTLDKVRAYLSEHQPLPANRQRRGCACRQGRQWRRGVRADIAPPGFRFFDNRQKYLLFVSTCSEKTEIANRVSLELANLQPSPPALRLFDAGVGDGTVLSRVMRALHARFPTMPLYVVAKEISYEDVRMMLEKMADRLFEHPATVLVVTNLYYAEAPWLTPRSVTSAQGLIWKDVALSGNTAHGFAEQIGELEGFLAENWRAGISQKTGNPVYQRPIVLTLRREDHSFLLDPIMPRPGRVMADYDLVIASQPYRARIGVEFKASKVVTPLVRALRPGGRLIGIHSHGHDPGMEIIDQVWPGEDPFKTDRYALLRQVKQELGVGRAPLQFQRVVRCALDLPLSHAHAAGRGLGPDRHLDAVRGLECRDLCGADRGQQAVGGGARRPLSRGHRPRAEEAWRALVQRRDLCDFAPPRAGVRRGGAMTASCEPASCELLPLLSSASVEISSHGHQLGELQRAVSPPAPTSPSPSCPATISAAMSRPRWRCAAPASIRCRTSPRAKLPRATRLNDFVARLRGEADVRRVLLIAGDVAAARGPFKSSRDVAATGLLQAHGITRVSVAGHPEGHPYLDEAATFASRLRPGATGARETGMRVDIVTQFCFESAPILKLLGELGARGIDLPVIIGLAGPATPATLTKFALRCGIGNSMRALRSQIGRFGRLLIDTGPDDCHARAGGRAAQRDVGRYRRLPPVPVRRIAQGPQLVARLS